MRPLLLSLALVAAGCAQATPSPPRRDLAGDSLSPLHDGGGCAPDTCKGCCWKGMCQVGVQAATCGAGGADCKTCPAPATCQSGGCVAPRCDPLSCATGCCDATGACQPGNADASCGSQATICEKCDPYDACVEHKCIARGPAMYKVTLVSAKVTGNSLIVCGFAELSECDLYVVLKLGLAGAQSTILPNTNNPVWNEYLLTALETTLITTALDVDVRDDDPIGSVSIGHCQQKVTAAALAAGQIVFDCGDAKQVTFAFQKL